MRKMMSKNIEKIFDNILYPLLKKKIQQTKIKTSFLTVTMTV